MVGSHSISTTSWELAFPNSHMVPLAVSFTTQMTQTTNYGLTRCLPRCLGISGSKILSISSYPKWVDKFLFSKSMLFENLYLHRIPKFRKQRNSEALIIWNWNQIPRLITTKYLQNILFLFGVTVEMSRLQSGNTLTPVRVVSHSFFQWCLFCR